MKNKIADFSKLSFILRSTLGHLNSIRESDASWCTAAETAICNLETEHGTTIQGTRTNSMEITSLSVQQFRVQAAISYLDTLIANINSRFPGDVVELVVSASVFNPALILDD